MSPCVVALAAASLHVSVCATRFMQLLPAKIVYQTQWKQTQWKSIVGPGHGRRHWALAKCTTFAALVDASPHVAAR